MVQPPAAYAAVAMPRTEKRRCDITVFGCTGNAGRAVAYHVLRSATLSSLSKTPIRVGFAGRNRDKIERTLEGIKAEIKAETRDDVVGESAIDKVEVNVIVADTTDPPSMLEMAESSRIVVSCAGPYNRYGEAAVVACIEGKAHYVDITGEVPWVSRMINDYNSSAEKAGVVLLPFSGYDCVPAELGMILAGSALEEHGGTDARMDQLNLAFRSAGGGGLPHGTLEVILDAFEGKKAKEKEGDARFYPKEYRKVAKAALSPAEFLLPKWSNQLNSYTGPNFMAGINIPVLCRAAPTLGFQANNLNISDRSVVAGRPSILNGRGIFPTQLYIGVLVMTGIAMILPPFRWWLRNKLKTYSYNGNAAAKVYVSAQATSNNGASSSVDCVYPGDAGIYATGLFATSVANALLEATGVDSKLPPPLAGFHTPVASLHRSGSELLVRHLRNLGAEINVKVMPPNNGAESKIVDASMLRSRL
eukprot:CAMPEP_0194146820 /NCGR_PEP_ID=MMETSP0152-20130528/21931_1 /TAXON_ID=1049557 /ORGANISM="Thalassiothrix antarctica, Strain L6-D1" /LENGTH=474 /DNA_ID=CAMNT_0038847449 /DNA_START=37 /DNA_END=1461 /DNA_ORIENTATION=-